MYAIYSFEDLTYHHDFSLIKKGFSDMETAESFKAELESGRFSSEYLAELVVCKELKTHDNKESNIGFDKEDMMEDYIELVHKYFGDVK